MKKTLLLTISLFFASLTFAGNAELFSVDEQALNEEFADLSALENYVVENNFVSLTQIETGKMFDLSEINLKTMGTSSQSDFMFVWDGFLWGFLCCPIGFFVVAVNENKDHDQKISYWIGVAASTVLGALSSTTYYY